MPQTTKTSTSVTKRNSKKTVSDLDNELGISEPYWNSDPTTMMMRVDGKYYKFDAEGNPYRFYPPGLRKPRKKLPSE
ncbi:hypothetical protein GCM10027592_19450 [Spirosoma flavus]